MGGSIGSGSSYLGSIRSQGQGSWRLEDGTAPPGAGRCPGGQAEWVRILAITGGCSMAAALRLCLALRRHQPGLEGAPRARAVLVLGALVLALHHEPAREMGDTDGGIGLVDVLAPAPEARNVSTRRSEGDTSMSVTASTSGNTATVQAEVWMRPWAPRSRGRAALGLRLLQGRSSRHGGSPAPPDLHPVTGALASSSPRSPDGPPEPGKRHPNGPPFRDLVSLVRDQIDMTSMWPSEGRIPCSCPSWRIAVKGCICPPTRLRLRQGRALGASP